MFFKKEDKLKDDKVTIKTIKQHRQAVLEKAKKFKYPVQYEKHKIMINTIVLLIFLVTVVLIGGYWQLYIKQSTNKFFLKMTQVLPLSVAEIDGQKVSYGDYLIYYSSSAYYHKNKQLDILSKQSKIEEFTANYKKQAMENALRVAYARKITNLYNLKISSQEKQEKWRLKSVFVDDKISEQTFSALIKDYYDLDKKEYEKIFIEYPILLKKAALAVDESAKIIIKEIEKIIKTGETDLEKIAKLYPKYATIINSGKINFNNNDDGRIEEALKLKTDQLSKGFVSRDLNSYYIVKLLSKDDKTLSHQALRLPLTKFNDDFKKIIEDKKVKYYIKI